MELESSLFFHEKFHLIFALSKWTFHGFKTSIESIIMSPILYLNFKSFFMSYPQNFLFYWPVDMLYLLIDFLRVVSRS